MSTPITYPPSVLSDPSVTGTYTDLSDFLSPHTPVRPISTVCVSSSLYGRENSSHRQHRQDVVLNHPTFVFSDENRKDYIQQDSVEFTANVSQCSIQIDSHSSVPNSSSTCHFTDMFDCISQFVQGDPTSSTNKDIFHKTMAIFQTILLSTPSDDTPLVLNLSSHQLSPSKLSVPQRGLKF